MTWYSVSDSRVPVLWDLPHGKRVATLEGHTNAVMNVRFDDRGALIVTASGDGTARLWDAHTGAPKGLPLTGSPQFLFDAAFDPSGAIIVGGGGDGVIRFWDVATSKLLWALDAHRSFVEAVGFADATHLLSRGWRGDLAVWELRDAELPESDLSSLLDSK